MDKKTKIKGNNLSLWLKDGISVDLLKLTEDLNCDVCIVGAGITGITTAYRLMESGLKVVLIDKNQPLNLASGNTTAKFTFQHGLVYHKIIENYDLATAKLFYKAQQDGLKYVRQIIQKHNIECDFKEACAIVHAENKEDFKEIQKEAKAYKQLDISYTSVDKLLYGLKNTGGLKVDNQFDLNPVKYLDKLLEILLKNNVSVFKDTEATFVKKCEDYIEVMTKNNNTIRCQKLVITTAYPFYESNGFYFTRLKAYRSYLMAFEIAAKKVEDLMVISNSDSPYTFRFSKTDNTNYLILGGQGHKVGQDNLQVEKYKNIINFAKEHFDTKNYIYKWSAQDYKTLDLIPYIGNLTSKDDNIYVATGFNKWGMSNGSFASLLLSDLILNKDSKYKEVFDPARGEVSDNFKNFAKSNLNVAKEFIKGKVSVIKLSLNDLESGNGAIIKYKGQRVAAYKDEAGSLFLSDSTCTHLGCELEYNDADKSFDCPCHGSRFNYDGRVIEGAAKKDLKKIT